MNLRDLHYFVILAEVRHFGEAAKRCFVSQPTLSMQIKKLEETLGVVLFERSNKQVYLTDQGQTLLFKAKAILDLVNEMKELARNAQDPFAGELRLGVIPTVAPYLLPLVMPLIKQTYPKLNVWLIEEQTQRLVNLLEEGTVDAAIMSPPITQSFASKTLYQEPFYFACAQQHGLANAKQVRVDQLDNMQVMLLEEGHCLREQAIAVCQMAKATEIADFTATSLATLRLMVQAGMGVTLLPALAVSAEDSEALRCIPFESPAPSRPLALFWRNGSAKIDCLQAIAELITQITIQKLGPV